MGMLKIAAVGALGYFAYKAWKGRQPTAEPASLEDATERAPAPRTPLLTKVSADMTATPRAGAQSSPGFGGED
ncbi:MULTISPECIES: hypothetical protein [Luteimonas]|uniref:hypothetical protein n=1 Tax=Luteimonas TaxID=83614 RepID=UPI000C7DCCBD|nr:MULTISPECIES: hypothetical protein [Luteimonas]